MMLSEMNFDYQRPKRHPGPDPGSPNEMHGSVGINSNESWRHTVILKQGQNDGHNILKHQINYLNL